MILGYGTLAFLMFWRFVWRDQSQPWVPLAALITASLGALWALRLGLRSIPRWLSTLPLVTITGFTAFLALSSPPAYEGPIRVGEPLPAFEAKLSNGETIKSTQLRGTLLVFFRGHW